ncbi:MAG: hypothetical protein J6P84_04765 [Alphaproteobacteria bacterium]|nr:hypothetical protein [Alphaproteobacteria bacterium]
MSWSDKVLTWVKNDSLNKKDIADKDGGFVTPTTVTSTPEYLIKVDNVFTSTIVNYEQFAECLWFEIGTARPSPPDPSNFFSGDRGILGKNPLVCMKYTRGATTIQQYLAGGNCIENIIIKRLAHLDMDDQEIQALSFYDCFITTYEQKNNLIFFSFSFTRMADEQAVFNNNGGKKGNDAFSFDFNKNKSDHDLGNDSKIKK